MAIRANKTVSLPDGRLLCYDECGPADGATVVMFHDVLSSRIGLAGPDQDAIAERLGLRLVAVDRPGIGASNPRPDRTVLDWPVDVVAFAELLGLSRFAVLGVGWASAYVAACAIRIPHRLWAAGVIAGVPPAAILPDNETPRAVAALGRGRRFGFLLRRRLRRLAEQYASNPSRMVDELIARAPPPDRERLANPALRHQLIEAGRETYRLGVEGALLDLRLVTGDWGFSPGDVPLVMNLWLGAADQEIPPAATRRLADALPRSETRVFPEGHWTLRTNRLEDLLSNLIATARREDGRPTG